MEDPVNEYVTRAPHPRLAPYVEEYTGYRAAGFEPGVHAGLPSRSLTLIVAFDDRLDVESSRPSGVERDAYWAMLGGLHSSPAVIRHPGRQHGVQLRLTPRGARALFATPASDLANDVVHLDAMAPAVARELVDRLSDAPTWTERWAVLDDIFLRIVSDDAEFPHQVEHAWSLLTSSHGTIGIDQLATSVGWSRRNLAARFKTTFGMSPKVIARVMRFERAQRLLRASDRPPLATVAAMCGYADQAHMTREWNEFAGGSPRAWMIEESIPILQDEDHPDLAP